ncbi:zinc finger protein 235-like [Armigeres subalbatus]|uniref:zinc finger protein 235-like n=1 Tax=Armigeres subalbatus TaxID=124917 RepID=UPI002ED21A9A
MENESESHLCRLCLREYNKYQMIDVLTEGCELIHAIYEAVSIKINRLDPTTSVCNNCQNIIHIINSFKTACKRSDDLLKNGPIILESEAWACIALSNCFHQTATLIEQHQQEVDMLYTNTAQSESRIIELTTCEEDVVNSDTILSVGLALPRQQNNTTHNMISEIQSSDSKPPQKQYESDSVAPVRRRGRKKLIDRTKDKVVCSTCGEMVSLQGLEGHMNRHLGVQPFPCDIEGCDAKLFSKFALQQHRSRHKSSNRYFDCKVCGKRIKGSAYWLIHRKIHEEEPKFACDICGKKFRRKCKLKLHSTVHSGIAEFPCGICGKFFTVKHNLTAHLKLHIKNGTYPAGLEHNVSEEAND